MTAKGRLKLELRILQTVLTAVFLQCLALLLPGRVLADGREVVVVYNTKLPESKDVADHYAQRRAVPTNQVIGLDLPLTEAVTRKDFIELLQRPLLQRLETAKLAEFSSATNRASWLRPAEPSFRRLQNTPLRYVVLGYGVPVKILHDPKVVEVLATNMARELHRTDAAVDSQLALLLDSEGPAPWIGFVPNPFFGATNASRMRPTNGPLLVARLDGPTPAIARALVDKALEAETNGLWGRAYFDLRGLTNGPYLAGDQMMGLSALTAMRGGFEVVLDEKPETFSAGFPISHAAIYMGWYDQHVSGPFLRAKAELMPGAFAYHLYSFSAQTLRTTNDMWTGALLALGAACTMGAVEEPYLSGTPDLYVFLTRWMGLGFTFGEAAYASLGSVSWQITVVGDPLYCPFGQELKKLHAELERRKSPALAWAQLHAVNRMRLTGSGPSAMLETLNPVSLPLDAPQRVLVRQSAVLTEKVGDLCFADGKLADAIDYYETALKRGATPMQRLRLLLTLAEKRSMYGPDDKALGWYEAVLKEFPDYPDALRVYQQMLPLAKRLNRQEAIDRCEREIKRLGPSAPPPASTVPPKA